MKLLEQSPPSFHTAQTAIQRLYHATILRSGRKMAMFWQALLPPKLDQRLAKLSGEIEVASIRLLGQPSRAYITHESDF
jgi:hypothetical protein